MFFPTPQATASSDLRPTFLTGNTNSGYLTLTWQTGIFSEKVYHNLGVFSDAQATASSDLRPTFLTGNTNSGYLTLTWQTGIFSEKVYHNLGVFFRRPSHRQLRAAACSANGCQAGTCF